MKFFWYCTVFFIIGYLVTLGCRPMTMPDEYRHAEIAREMRHNGMPFSPRLLTVRYFEKPVFCHYCNIASTVCFGENAFGLRFPAAIFTGLTGAMIAATVWRRRRDAKLAALAFGFYTSFALVYGIATMPITDAPATFFTTAAVFSAFLASLEDAFSRRRFFLEILCGLALAGGFYTKGAVGLAVPGVSIFFFLVWEKKWREFYRLPLVILPVFLAISLPVAWKIHQAEPDFWNYFINVEHIQRFMQNAAGQHPQPWWYFLPVVIAGTIPGITFLPCLFGLGKEGWNFIFSRPIYRMALCSAVFPFLLFSASNGKLPTYILPCFPGLAIFLAGGVMSYLRGSLDSRLFNATIRFWTGFFGVAAVLAAAVALLATEAHLAIIPDTDLRNALCALRPALAVIAVAAALFGTALFVVRKKARTVILMTFFAGLALLSCAVNPMLHARIDNGKFPGESIALVTRQSGINADDADIVAIPSLGYAVAWTLNRSDVMLTPSPGELRYGINAAEQKGEKHPFLTPGNMKSLIRKGEKPVFFFTRPDKEQIDGIAPKKRIIDQNIQLDIF